MEAFVIGRKVLRVTMSALSAGKVIQELTALRILMNVTKVTIKLCYMLKIWDENCFYSV